MSFYFRRCSHSYPPCVAARLAGEVYHQYEMCPKEAAENEAHIRAELAAVDAAENVPDPPMPADK